MAARPDIALRPRIARGRSPHIAYVIDPRFPGGTSSAVAQELAAVARDARLSVHAISSRMFDGREVAPQLARALDGMGQELIWDAPRIEADTVILHNPSFLKFQAELPVRIVTRHLIVVTHENFERPGGAEAFDVARCLDQIDRATLALRKSIAPISPHNRATVAAWQARTPLAAVWDVLPEDWFNICEFALAPPTDRPRDRRGRHSRPGFEKFPSLAAMDLCFPPRAANVILGGDSFADAARQRPHWTIYPFQTLEVADYFEMMDVMVYFTAATFRESFGRVLAEAIAAGKLVISDADTASAFGGAVVAGMPGEVDAIIARFTGDPALYRQQVLRAQQRMRDYSAEAFRARFGGILGRGPVAAV